MTTFIAGVSRVATRSRFALFAASLLLAACGTKEATAPIIPDAFGRVRFVNLITDPNRQVVNAILEGVPFGVNLGYGGTTPSSLPSPANAIYSPILTGSRTLVLKRTADTSVVVGAPIPLQIATGVDYTVYATGGVTIAPFITTDTNSTPAAGQARVRVVHLAPSAPNVDIFVTAVGADLATATPVLTNVALRQSAYLSVAAGTYQVRAVPAGVVAGVRAANVAINLATVTLPAGAARTIIAADNSTGGTPFRFIALADR